MLETVSAKIDDGARLDREEGRWLLTEAPLLELGSSPTGAPPPPSGRRGDVRHRLQPQLHERLHHRLPVLRLLPQARATRRRTRSPSTRCWRRSSRRVEQGRDHRAPPGRPQPRPAARLLPRRSSARRAAASRASRRTSSPPPRSRRWRRCRGLAVGDVLDRLCGGGPAHAARRRRRGPLRARAHSASSPRRAGRRRGSRCTARRTGAGFKSTATMMYGHVEEAGRRPRPPRRDPRRSRTSTAASPPSSRGRSSRATRCSRSGSSTTQGPNAYLRMLAVSRLYLDNFPHVQASWFSEGKRAGPDRAALRRRRLGRHALRGERPQGRRLREHDHGRRDRDADPRGRLHARPAHHALRARSERTSAAPGARRSTPVAARSGRWAGRGDQPRVDAPRGRAAPGPRRPSSPSAIV